MQGQVASLAAAAKKSGGCGAGQEPCCRHRRRAGGGQSGGDERTYGPTRQTGARGAAQYGDTVHLLQLAGELGGTVPVGLALGVRRGAHS